MSLNYNLKSNLVFLPHNIVKLILDTLRGEPLTYRYFRSITRWMLTRNHLQRDISNVRNSLYSGYFGTFGKNLQNIIGDRT